MDLSKMKISPLVLFVLNLACMQMKYGWDVKTPDQLYDDCIKTFEDESKCKEFVSKEAIRPQATATQYPELSEEDRAKLFVRQDLKDKIQFKNKLYVRHLLGEPDEILFPNGVHEDWIYRRPISVYQMGAKPDREFRIRFQKGTVQMTNHKSPLPEPISKNTP